MKYLNNFFNRNFKSSVFVFHFLKLQILWLPLEIEEMFHLLVQRGTPHEPRGWRPPVLQLQLYRPSLTRIFYIVTLLNLLIRKIKFHAQVFNFFSQISRWRLKKNYFGHNLPWNFWKQRYRRCHHIAQSKILCLFCFWSGPRFKTQSYTTRGNFSSKSVGKRRKGGAIVILLLCTNSHASETEHEMNSHSFK